MEENGEKEKIHAPSVNLSKIKDEPLSDDEKTNICVRPWAEGALFVSTNEEMANKPICQMEQKDNGLCSVASVTLPLTKIKEEPCSDGYSMPNNTQTNKEHIMTNYSGEPLKEEQVEPIPPEDTSFEDVYMKEEESILDDNHSQEQSSDEEMFFNSDSQEEPCKLNNDGSGPSKATQEVYIKEEFDTDMEGSEDNVTELTNHNRMPDHGFGNHFLTHHATPFIPIDESNKNLDMPKKGSRNSTTNPSKWKCNIRKQQYQAGNEYISRRGKMVSAKTVKNTKDCVNKCRYKCSSKISNYERTQLNAYYYSLSVIEKRRFLVTTTGRTLTARPQNTSNESKQRNRMFSFKYFFSVKGEKISVCKDFYLGTLSISQKPIYNVHSSRKHEKIHFSKSRGKNPSEVGEPTPR